MRSFAQENATLLKFSNIRSRIHEQREPDKRKNWMQGSTESTYWNGSGSLGPINPLSLNLSLSKVKADPEIVLQGMFHSSSLEPDRILQIEEHTNKGRKYEQQQHFESRDQNDSSTTVGTMTHFANYEFTSPCLVARSPSKQPASSQSHKDAKQGLP
ncbi:hypothetical protein CEXT_807041 [Caerostris extrusa]|uniref:Uncharacterized protein n=1 Tax=Caerostris extrusa TaxID=172846 RepID=A0AAV4QRR6_CAEEX|nr:hypothetical protein CEXT_807041 [Caerostris extrusa]